MKTLYYIKKKELEKEHKLNFEYATDLVHINVYEIRKNIPELLCFVKMFESLNVELELLEHLEHNGIITNGENAKLIEL